MNYAREARARAERLRAAFNPDATRHIRLTQLDDDGHKTVVTRLQSPSLHDYRTHLHDASRGGPGALGVSPTFDTAGTGRASRFLAAFAAVDLDDTKPERVQPVVEALAARGVALYLSRGTSGRGTHGYTLFEQAVPCSVAVTFARNIARSFTDAGHRVDKIFPSSANAIGTSILLLYRAADADGVGLNPLLVPGDLRPLPLSALKHATRVPASVIERINADLLGSDVPRHRKTRHTDTADPVFHVKDEERRLTPLWRDGRRTNLALGFSGAAAMAGVPMAVAAKAIERLERGGPDAPHVRKRVAITDRTYAQHAAGRPIAFARFYETAGVAAPVLRPHHADIVARLSLVDWRCADSLGRSAASSRRILRALHDLAARFGRMTDAGVSVTVSRRELAVLSGLAVSTVNAKLGMLIDVGLLRIESNRRNNPREAAGFELLLKKTKSDHSPQQPVHVLGGQHEWSDIVHAKLFSRVGLGPTPGVVVAALHAHGPMKRTTLATITGRSTRTILRAIHRLEAHDLVKQRTDGVYALPTDALERLPEIEERVGVNARLERRAKRLQHEQREWRLGTSRPRAAERDTRPTTKARDPTSNHVLSATASCRIKLPQASGSAAQRVGAESARPLDRQDARIDANTTSEESTEHRRAQTRRAQALTADREAPHAT